MALDYPLYAALDDVEASFEGLAESVRYQYYRCKGWSVVRARP